jgi:hypothetical protein
MHEPEIMHVLDRIKYLRDLSCYIVVSSEHLNYSLKRHVSLRGKVPEGISRSVRPHPTL